MQNIDVYYRIFYYMIVGAEGVGKTNLITRFIKDEFIEAHNLTLEGQQSAIFVIDHCKFKIIFRDNRNVNELKNISIDNYKHIDGVIFVFSLENEQTLSAIQNQMNYYLNEINPVLIRNKRRLPHILVGNKLDLLPSSLSNLDIIDHEADKQIKKGEQGPSISARIKRFEDVGVKYFQTSTKCSTKKQIQAIFLEMINQNEINRFVVDEPRSTGWWQTYLPAMPCASEQFRCQIY